MLLELESEKGKNTINKDLRNHSTKMKVACTQPRRVAAMSIAERVAQECDVRLGQQVGYSIRFEDKTSSCTRLTYLTDGMLLREAMGDPRLEKYDAIVLDEAHERTVQTDLLLGFLKRLLPERPELKVVIMSATLESEKFQAFFPQAPVLRIPGRVYPVEVVYTKQTVPDYLESAIHTVVKIHRSEPPGDILLFLPGEEEIEDACLRIEERIASLRRNQGNGATLEASTFERNDVGIESVKSEAPKSPIPPLRCIPAYAALPPHVLQRIFDPAPPGGRKVVIATNIAETSLTIDGVVYVVDPGFSKQKVFNPRTRVESLLVTPISQAACDQRKGRAGRTCPGKCYRLFPLSAFEELVPQTYPELLRVNLSSVVLTMLRLGISNLIQFDFLDAPAPETLMHALEVLHFIGAMDEHGALTATGNRMAEFPLDPQLARSILAGYSRGVGPEMCAIAAMLNAPRVLLAPRDRKAVAAQAHQTFADPSGDHLLLMNALRGFVEANQSADWAKAHFLNLRGLRTALHITQQLENTARRVLAHKPARLAQQSRSSFLDKTLLESRPTLNTKQSNAAPETFSGSPRSRSGDLRGDYDKNTKDVLAKNGSLSPLPGDTRERVLQSLLCGHFMNVAHSVGKRTYRLVRGQTAVEIHPGSGLLARGGPLPEFVLYHEYVFTSRHYIRTVSAVKGRWVVGASPGYFDPGEMPEGYTQHVFLKLQREFLGKGVGENGEGDSEDSDEG